VIAAVCFAVVTGFVVGGVWAVLGVSMVVVLAGVGWRSWRARSAARAADEQ